MITRTSNNKNSFWSIIYYVFFLGLAVFLLYYCFRNINFTDLYKGLKEANQLMIWLSILAGFIAYILRALRWKILIEPLGYKPSLLRVYDALMIGYTINIVLPRVGEVTRCAILTKTNKVPIEPLFGTVVMERVIDLLCMMIAVVLVFFLRIDFFGAFLSKKIFLPLWSQIEEMEFFLFALIACLGVGFSFVYFFWRKWMRFPLVQKVKNSLDGIVQGLKSIFRMKQYLLFLLYTLGIWVCFWLTSYLVVLAVPNTAELTAADGLFLMVLGSMGWVVPVPGGMGSFHYIVALGLSVYGITFEPDGVIFATIAHESQLIPMVVLGIISFLSVSFSQKMDAKRTNNLVSK